MLEVEFRTGVTGDIRSSVFLEIAKISLTAVLFHQNQCFPPFGPEDSYVIGRTPVSSLFFFAVNMFMERAARVRPNVCS